MIPFPVSGVSIGVHALAPVASPAQVVAPPRYAGPASGPPVAAPVSGLGASLLAASFTAAGESIELRAERFLLMFDAGELPTTFGRHEFRQLRASLGSGFELAVAEGLARVLGGDFSEPRTPRGTG